MKIRQMHEWKVLLAHIKAEEEMHLRRHWTQIGLAKYLRKIAVIRQLLEYYEKKRRLTLEEYHHQLKESLKRRHENEARELRRRYDALMRLERREEASFFIAYGGFSTSSARMTLTVSFPELYLGSSAVQPVRAECYTQNIEGWQSAPYDVPDHFEYEFGTGGDNDSLSFTFNMNVEASNASAQSVGDTDEEEASAHAHAPSFGSGMSM